MTKLKYIQLFENFKETFNKVDEKLQLHKGIGETDIDVSSIFGTYTTPTGKYNSKVSKEAEEKLELKIKEIVSTLKENEEIKKIVLDWSKRFLDENGSIKSKSSVDKNSTILKLFGKIYQSSKNIFDFEEEVKDDKGEILGRVYQGKGHTYGHIMKSIINNNIDEITGIDVYLML